MLGRDKSTKDILRDMARREEDYGNRIAMSKILRELTIGIEKMKGSVKPAFREAFPDQPAEVSKTTDTYIKDTKDFDKSTGLGGFGAFGLAAALALARTYRESNLVLQEVERLRKVFSKDESVMLFLNNLKEEHRFTMDRVHQVASSEERSNPSG